MDLACFVHVKLDSDREWHHFEPRNAAHAHAIDGYEFVIDRFTLERHTFSAAAA